MKQRCAWVALQAALGLLAWLSLATPAQAFVCIKTSSGLCIHWAEGAATLRSFLGFPPPPTTLINGTASFDQNVLFAANDWNAVGAGFQYSVSVGGALFAPCGPRGPRHACPNTGPAGDNPILFTTDFCGQGFGDIIELTNNCYNPATGAMINAPVFVNWNVTWNAYDGPLRFPANDIRRVMLHEFGHVLGLDHPDDHRQQVAAIMNSRESTIDRLQADDIDGIFALYPNGAPPSSEPSASGAANTGCQMARRDPSGGGALWLLAAFAIAACARGARGAGAENSLSE